ncbi:MAG TPA: hypothetical protein VM865_01705 [Acidobacteriaceae bacterium]|jgi:galactose mutarotase-like enzyme|nr:hypothetical protein [Acidobacteriaceae bacterium]
MDLGKRLSSDSHAASRFRRFSTSGYLTPILVALFCAIFLFAAHEAHRGNYTRIRSHVIPANLQPPLPTGPGGQDAVILRRNPTAIGGEPELISATLLPGRGMNVLQITASVPGRGEVPLLVAPSLSDASRILTGSGDDANGSVSATCGAAVLAPWAGRLTGSPTSSSSTLESIWQGQRITFPPSRPGATVSTLGMLLDLASDNLGTDSVPEGQAVSALYHAGSFSGQWPSMTDVTIRAELAGRSFDLTVTEHNTGQVPMPAGIGWHPVFALPGNRSDVRLTIPSITRVDVDHRTGLPSGKLTSTVGTPIDFIHARGTPLGDIGLNDTFTELQSGILGDGPIVEIRNLTAGYGLRLTPLTNSIKFLRVIAPNGQSWISVEPDTNVDDPLGHQWTGQAQTGLVTLQPGESLQWHVRLEIFSLRLPDTGPGSSARNSTSSFTITPSSNIP